MPLLQLGDLLAGRCDKFVVGVRVTVQPPAAGHGFGQEHPGAAGERRVVSGVRDHAAELAHHRELFVAVQSARAVEAALAHGSRRAEAAAQLGGPEALAMAIDAYLSPLHRDKPETGCAVAALPTDIARSSQRAREAYTAQVRRYLDLYVELTPGDDPDDPPLILAALVGAIALARAVNDPALSDEILDKVARALNRHVQGE